MTIAEWAARNQITCTLRLADQPGDGDFSDLPETPYVAMFRHRGAAARGFPITAPRDEVDVLCDRNPGPEGVSNLLFTELLDAGPNSEFAAWLGTRLATDLAACDSPY